MSKNTEAAEESANTNEVNLNYAKSRNTELISELDDTKMQNEDLRRTISSINAKIQEAARLSEFLVNSIKVYDQDLNNPIDYNKSF